MSHRIQIVLPEPAVELLRERAADAGLAPSTLVAELVRERLQAPAGAPSLSGHPSRSAQRQKAVHRPGWLEPYGDSRTWRAETWGAIVALHARYPKALSVLRDRWWQDQAQLETLVALAAWRTLLDTAADDPREELRFHEQLDAYSQKLKSEGGGVQTAWQPGAPPQDWARP